MSGPGEEDDLTGLDLVGIQESRREDGGDLSAAQGWVRQARPPFHLCCSRDTIICVLPSLDDPAHKCNDQALLQLQMVIPYAW